MTPELRITVLMENTAREGLEAEHGLSFFLEYRGRRFLLDAGSSGRFADNAQKLGVDLDGVELAALSHGHYDLSLIHISPPQRTQDTRFPVFSRGPGKSTAGQPRASAATGISSGVTPISASFSWTSRSSRVR